MLSSYKVLMAYLRLVFLFSTTLPLILISCNHANSLVYPLTSASDITFLSEHSNITDRQVLVSFKSMMSSDPTGSLASWNGSIHFCNWLGVTCSGRRHPQRVISLNLSSLDLVGVISPSIANLTFLRMLDLSNNKFHGPIPLEIDQLHRLQHLNMSVNSLEGGIPAMPSLSTNLSSLSILSLYDNQLSGDIPPTLGNLVSLTHLFLYENQLSGAIPPSLGKLPKLEKLFLYSNNLSGAIPTSLWNMSSLVSLDLSYNSLSGSLPPTVGQALPLLEEIFLYNNHLHGPIPVSFSNASRLVYIDISFNTFGGAIPVGLRSLRNLLFLNLVKNQLESREPDGLNFLTDLINYTKIEILGLDWNNLDGSLPNFLANSSTNIQSLSMGSNDISGNIPPSLGNLVSLTILDLGPNSLTGSIPDSIGMLQNLVTLDLNSNKLSGNIPSTFGNLTQLNQLFLGDNELSGTIPANLGNCQQLNVLNLGSNKLTGVIPKEILRISTLTVGLDLSQNSLSGVIPSEVGSLRNLGIIDFSSNELSGQLPSTLGECMVLEELYLHGNFFQGNIPSSLASLRGIRVLDASQNNLSGRIPDFLQRLPYLYDLNLSFNNFEGEVPRNGVFANASAVSVLGNNKLCGGNPAMRLPACPSQTSNRTLQSHTLLMIVSIASSFLLSVFVCLLVVRCWVQKSRRKPTVASLIEEQHVKVSYAELARATSGFSRDNLIGTGSFGAVYKGVLGNDHDGLQIVAVKVLNLQLPGASKSFVAECEALRNVRHRNLVKVITVCSSVDFRGNDFKAVVFELMANGSLDDWLHTTENRQPGQKKLSLVQRLNIAIDVASALDYLHCRCEPPIVHCDLKPSNILLDSDLIAHVGDFGLAKLLQETISKSSSGSTSSIGLKGTIGYIAPEYGMVNKVSVQGDVYSYGILLLEMFTAKRPTDAMFKEGQRLREFVELAYPNRILDITDARLFLVEDEEASDDAHIDWPRTMECLASVFRIGIECSNELPVDRMKMQDVISELHKVRDVFTKGERS